MRKRRSRRFAIQTAVSAFAGIAASGTSAIFDSMRRMTLGFSTYGMKGMPLEQAIEAIAEVGFESIEICVRPEWGSAPSDMNSDRRAAICKQLTNRSLSLTALMEHLPPAAAKVQHEQHLERLKGVYELACDLGASRPPIVQTVLGDGEWEKQKNLFRDRVADWVQIGEKHHVITCIKPHRGGAMSKPSEAIWLIKQLDSTPWLRIVYDYSHLIYRDISLTESLREALPYLAHVAVKDAVMNKQEVSFLLPGEAGTIDFQTMFTMLQASEYQGDVSCEVSGMVSNKPGYDPIAAAKTCFQNLDFMFRTIIG